MADDEGINESEAPKKRKTTYNRDHPTENPKPPKRSRGEIQAAAAAKRAALMAKKKELADLKAAADLEKDRKKQKALKEIVAAEDAVQRQQRQRQLQAERPDLQTMETYRTIQEARISLEGADDDSTRTPPPGEIEQGGDLSSDVEMPPQPTVDTDSDGGLLGMDNLDAGLESEEEDIYAPAADKGDEDEEAEFSNASNRLRKTSKKKRGKQEKVEDKEAELSDASNELRKTSKKPRDKKEKVRIQIARLNNYSLVAARQWLKEPKGKLRAEIQVHCEVATPVYAPVDARGRMQEGRRSGKPMDIGGLQKNWKERAQPESHTSSIKASSATPTKGGQQRTTTATSHPDSDDEIQNLAAPPQKKQQTTPTSESGIKLRKAGPQKAINFKPGWRAAKPRYNNNHLPFENFHCNLRTWHLAALPAIIDWAGTLEDGFGVNAHPNLQEIIQDNWNDEFPSIECDEAVLSMASSAIRNWRSSIGKYALQRLTKLFGEEPYKYSREQRKEYVADQLRDLCYIYRNPDTKSGAYRSSIIIEIYAVHQQLVAKTDKFYGYPGGALALCAAAHERALKLWRSGDPPDKDTKTSFIHKPWAIRAAAHFQTIKKLSESKWSDIVEAAVSVMESRNDEFDPTGDNDSELDDPDEVLISEDEAATSD